LLGWDYVVHVTVCSWHRSADFIAGGITSASVIFFIIVIFPKHPTCIGLGSKRKTTLIATGAVFGY
jgi:hypothetical protein